MTSFDLFEAMGDIPEDMLEELDMKRRRGVRLLPVAAACILVSAVSLAVYHFGDDAEISQMETRVLETEDVIVPATYPVTGSVPGERNAEDIYPAVGGIPETGTVMSENMLTGGDIYGYPYDPDEQYPVYTTIYDPEEKAFISPGYDPANPGEPVTIAPAYEPGDPGLTATETMRTDHNATVSVETVETIEVVTTICSEADASVNITTVELVHAQEMPKWDVTAPEYTGEYLPETAVIPRWEDMDDMERYSALDYSGITYAMTDKKFDLSELTYIGPGELWGYDVYTETTYSKDDIGVYAIDGVNPRYMAAVLTADGKYTGFEDMLYKPDTLGDYLADTDFERRHFPAKLYSGDVVSAWEHMEYDFPELEEQVKILLEAGREAGQVSVPPPDFGVSIYSLVDSSGEYVMTIYGGGCIVVLGKIFNVGEENTEYFINMAERSSVKSELMPYGESAGGQGDIVPE